MSIERKIEFLSRKLSPEEVNKVLKRIQTPIPVAPAKPSSGVNVFGFIGLGIISLVTGGIFFVSLTQSTKKKPDPNTEPPSQSKKLEDLFQLQEEALHRVANQLANLESNFEDLRTLTQTYSQLKQAKMQCLDVACPIAPPNHSGIPEDALQSAEAFVLLGSSESQKDKILESEDITILQDSP